MKEIANKMENAHFCDTEAVVLPVSNATGEVHSELTRAVRYAVPYTTPMLLGFIALGMTYGVLMGTKGYGCIWAVLMSAIAFCGSMQYVALTLLVSAFNPLQAFILSILVNARHLFYGLSMLNKYNGFGKIKYLMIFMMCDETFSITYSMEPPEGINRKYFFATISILDYSYWVIGTLLGGLAGNLITFDTTGIDFALTALFAVLFAEQWMKKENRVPAIIGVVSTIISLAIFGSSNLVIPAMLIILAVLSIGRKKLCI